MNGKRNSPPHSLLLLLFLSITLHVITAKEEAATGREQSGRAREEREGEREREKERQPLNAALWQSEEEPRWILSQLACLRDTEAPSSSSSSSARSPLSSSSLTIPPLPLFIPEHPPTPSDSSRIARQLFSTTSASTPTPAPPPPLPHHHLSDRVEPTVLRCYMGLGRWSAIVGL